MYDIKKTIQKFWREGIAISIIGVIAVWLAAQAEKIGITLDPEWIITGLTAVGAAIFTAVTNWWKHRRD